MPISTNKEDQRVAFITVIYNNFQAKTLRVGSRILLSSTNKKVTHTVRTLSATLYNIEDNIRKTKCWKQQILKPII